MYTPLSSKPGAVLAGTPPAQTHGRACRGEELLQLTALRGTPFPGSWGGMTEAYGGSWGFLLPGQLWGRQTEAGVTRTAWAAPDLPEVVCEVLLTWSSWQKSENNPSLFPPNHYLNSIKVSVNV